MHMHIMNEKMIVIALKYINLIQNVNGLIIMIICMGSMALTS